MAHGYHAHLLRVGLSGVDFVDLSGMNANMDMCTPSPTTAHPSATKSLTSTPTPAHRPHTYRLAFPQYFRWTAGHDRSAKLPDLAAIAQLVESPPGTAATVISCPL